MTKFDVKDKRIIVTGGSGFLGKFVVDKLKQKGCNEVIIPRSKQYNLSKEKDVMRLFEDNKSVDCVIHLAADVGGIGYNRKNPGSVLYNNIIMNTLIMEHSRKSNVKKFVGIGSVCSYPKYTEIPFKEENLWNGYPEETNASYGLSKKIMLEQGQAYKRQYGFNAIHLLMINLYGPGDNFDLENSHVVPALIRKFIEAKEEDKKQVEVWGDGSASREFLYVEDAANAIVLATESYSNENPINIGSGEEVEIKQLVALIKDIVRYEGEIIWDTTKPNGQPRRCLDISKAKDYFGFESSTRISEGVRKTISWYYENLYNK